jgi:hypothetical protein
MTGNDDRYLEPAAPAASDRGIDPVLVSAVADTLTKVSGYNAWLRSFLLLALGSPEILSRLDWTKDDPTIASELVGLLVQEQDRYRNELIRLVDSLTQLEDFVHLLGLEAGSIRVAEAQAAVVRLRLVAGTDPALVGDIGETSGEHRQPGSSDREFDRMMNQTDPTARGVQLHRILRRVFRGSGLDFRSSIDLAGGRIEGSLTVQGYRYILRAVWEIAPLGMEELDGFRHLVATRRDGYLGLLLSLSGFERYAIRLHNTPVALIVLADDDDLGAVVAGRVDIASLISGKRDHVKRTGEIFSRVDGV